MANVEDIFSWLVVGSFVTYEGELISTTITLLHNYTLSLLHPLALVLHFLSYKTSLLLKLDFKTPFFHSPINSFPFQWHSGNHNHYGYVLQLSLCVDSSRNNKEIMSVLLCIVYPPIFPHSSCIIVAPALRDLTLTCCKDGTVLHEHINMWRWSSLGSIYNPVSTLISLHGWTPWKYNEH